MFLWPSFFFLFSEVSISDFVYFPSPFPTLLHSPVHPEQMSLICTSYRHLSHPLCSASHCLRTLISLYFQVSFLFFSSLVLFSFSSAFKHVYLMPVSPLFSAVQAHRLAFSFSLACFPSFFGAFLFLLGLQYSFHFPLKHMLQHVSILFSNHTFPFIRHY